MIVSHDKDSLVLDVRAPLEAYDMAYGTDLAADPTDAVAAAKTGLISQLEDTVSISFADGPSWTTSITNVGTAEINGAPNLSVRLVATPPAGLVPGPVELNWRFITGYFDTHKVFAVLAENVSTVLQAKTINPATILGVLTAQESVLTIEDRAPVPPSQLCSVSASSTSARALTTSCFCALSRSAPLGGGTAGTVRPAVLRF